MTDPAMKDDTATEQAADCAELINAVGLHARPSVKLTQLAKTFDCRVEIALSADGPWVDAKSPVKVMRVKAPRGAVLHVRTSGNGAQAAMDALMLLVRSGFGEATDHPADARHG
jgi:phosphocarrier protein